MLHYDKPPVDGYSGAQVRDASRPWLLAPVELEAITACGVTFAASMLERVVEEQAKGGPGAADGIRASLMAYLFARDLLQAGAEPVDAHRAAGSIAS